MTGAIKRRNGEARDILLNAMRADPEHGFSVSDCQRVLGLATVQDARRRMNDLQAIGVLFQARRQGDVFRWFTTRALASAWSGKPELESQAEPFMHKPSRPMTGALGAFPMKVPVQVFTQEQPQTEAAPAVPTMALSRSQLALGRVSARREGEPFGGGFASSGIGRDAVTGQPWGQ